MTSHPSLHESLYLSTESPPPSFLVKHRMLLLAVLGVVLYVGCIGLIDLWYPDEPDIAEVAQAMFVSFFIGAGLLVYASSVGDRIRWWPRVAAFVLLGLALLTKGPLGLLLPGLVLTLWHGSRREWRPLLELAPLSLISLAIYLLW